MAKARKRRGRGEGGVFQRADGRWVGEVSHGIAANGKRVRKTAYGDSTAEVLEEVRKLQTEHDAGRLAVAGELTVGEYLQRRLKVAETKTAANTLERYEDLTNHYLIPAFGKLKLSKLRPLHVEQAYAALCRTTAAGGVKKATNETKKFAGIVLGAALRHAVRLGLIPSNPAAEVAKPRSAFREMLALTPTQAKLLLDGVRPRRNFAPIVTAIGTGYRLGELLAITWADINLDEGALDLKRSVSYSKGRHAIEEPKSEAGRLTISWPPLVVAALVEHRTAAMRNGHIAAPIFCSMNGTYHAKPNVRRLFKDAIKKINAGGDVVPPSIRFHVCGTRPRVVC